MQNIIPIGKRCLVKPYQAAEKTESGLLMNNESNVSAAPVKGTVVAAGRGRWWKLWLDGSEFQVGDVLYFRRYSIDILKTITEKGEQVVNVVEDADVIAKELPTNE